MLAPAMRGKLIAELEYQHENAATPANMVREDPLNYEAYATVCNLSFFSLDCATRSINIYLMLGSLCHIWMHLLPYNKCVCLKYVLCRSSTARQSSARRYNSW